MISEESHDTDAWSNDCWKVSFAITGINGILKYIKIENYFNILKYNKKVIFIISHTITVFFFYQINGEPKEA